MKTEEKENQPAPAAEMEQGVLPERTANVTDDVSEAEAQVTQDAAALQKAREALQELWLDAVDTERILEHLLNRGLLLIRHPSAAK